MMPSTSLAALLAPLRGRVALSVARQTRSFRTKFAWIDVRVSPADQEGESDVALATEDSLVLLRDALVLLVATLQRSNGRKSEWKAVLALLKSCDSDIWDEIEECGELEVLVRITGHLETLRSLLLQPDDHQEHAAFEDAAQEFQSRAKNLRRTGRRPKVPICLAVRAPREAAALGVEFSHLYLTELLNLVRNAKPGSAWAVQELELDIDLLAIDMSMMQLLEELCQSVSTVSSLRIHVPHQWSVAEVAEFIQRLDQCDSVRGLCMRFDRATQLALIADAVGTISTVHYVELLHVTERRLQDTFAEHHHDVDLTNFFRPTQSPPLVPTLRCTEWSLHPVHVVTWFWSPLDLDHQSPVASLDLDLDAMRIATLLAVLEHVGPSLRSLTLRGTPLSTRRGPVPALPLDAFLSDCPHLQHLEIRGRFRIASLSQVLDHYAARKSQTRSMAFVDVVFDDDLTPGLFAVVKELTNRDSVMARSVRELRVEPVDTLENEPQLLDAIVHMLHVNLPLEMFVLQNERGVVPPVLWQRIHSLHLRSATTLYAFVSVVACCQRGDSEAQDLGVIALLGRDALTTIFSFLERPVRRKLRQRA